MLQVRTPSEGAGGFFLRRVNNPVVEPLTLAEVKEALRVAHDQEDAQLTSLISAARESLEDRWSLTMIRTRLRLTFESCVSCRLILPKGPTLSVVQVKATPVAGEGTEVTLPETAYRLKPEADLLFIDVSYYGNMISVEYEAGFGNTPAEVPHAVKQALILYIHAMYESPGGSFISVPPLVSALLAPYLAFRV